jgi:hypothetical protein
LVENFILNVAVCWNNQAWKLICNF